jgi:hypothetical protein
LFSIEESHRLLSIAKKGLVKGGSNGGASILDLHSGALSKVSLVPAMGQYVPICFEVIYF